MQDGWSWWILGLVQRNVRADGVTMEHFWWWTLLEWVEVSEVTVGTVIQDSKMLQKRFLDIELGILEQLWGNILWVATVTFCSILPAVCWAIAKDLYHCDKILQCALENGDYLFTKEEAFITGVSAVVGAVEEALLLWWTQFKCTECTLYNCTCVFPLMWSGR